MKETKRDLTRTQRQLGRDSAGLDREEKQLIAKIKEAEKRGNIGEMKILAKQVVSIRKEKEKLSGMTAKLGQVKNQASMMKANHAMGQAMATTAKTMKQMNKASGMDKMQDTMMEYQRQMAAMGVNEEMMDDMLSSEFDEEADAEADDIVRKTLDELGIDSTKALGEAPRHKVGVEETDEDAEADRLMKQVLGLSS